MVQLHFGCPWNTAADQGPRIGIGGSGRIVSRIRMDAITPPLPPHPRTELKDKCKSKLACAKSRESAKTPQKTDAKCDTHRKTPEKTMRNGKLGIFLYSAARRLAHFFVREHPQKPMRKQNANSIPGEQSATTRVSAHASKEIATPRAAADGSAANNNHHNHPQKPRSSSRTSRP